MKKSLLIATLFLAATMGAAQAADFDLSAGRNSQEQTVTRVGVSNAVYGLDTNLSYTRAESKNASNVTAFTVGKQLVSFGPVKVSAFAGPAFAQTKTQTGFGGVYGVSLKYPLATNVDAVVDARRFQGKTSINSVDGNTVTAGVAVKF